jgi:preprotein translocase subunit SecB
MRAEMKKTRHVLSADPIQIGPANIQLDGYYVKELNCSVRDDLDEDAHLMLGTGLHIQPHQVMVCPTPGVDVEILVGQHPDDQSKFRIVLQISSAEGEDSNPYVFSITLAGYFSVKGVKLVKESNLFFYRNGVMLLYSAAREIMAATTARGPFPAFILPTLTFDLTERTWKSIVESSRRARQLAENEQPRQLPPATKTPSKKKASKKGAKK